MSKKRLISLTLPLTFISFILFSKWWIVDVIDGSDCIAYGFPFIYKAPAFYTSLAEQYFIMEFCIDFLVYFALILTLLFFATKYISRILLNKKVFIIIYVVATILIGIEILFSTVFKPSFSIRRDFEIEVKQTGVKFYFSNNEKEEFNKLHQ